VRGDKYLWLRFWQPGGIASGGRRSGRNREGARRDGRASVDHPPACRPPAGASWAHSVPWAHWGPVLFLQEVIVIIVHSPKAMYIIYIILYISYYIYIYILATWQASTKLELNRIRSAPLWGVHGPRKNEGEVCSLSAKFRWLNREILWLTRHWGGGGGGGGGAKAPSLLQEFGGCQPPPSNTRRIRN